jgi:erythronate-4-phosphate dehydrogenase
MSNGFVSILKAAQNTGEPVEIVLLVSPSRTYSGLVVDIALDAVEIAELDSEGREAGRICIRMDAIAAVRRRTGEPVRCVQAASQLAEAEPEQATLAPPTGPDVAAETPPQGVPTPAQASPLPPEIADEPELEEETAPAPGRSKTDLRIVADENIPYVREAFSRLGAVETLPGRNMKPEHVRDADILLVRSITKVNADLLEGSSVRFVATATIGEDHIDKQYLKDHGIAFSSAPGCNANSVGQYITAALLALCDAFELEPRRLSLGIVGVGNVGAIVHKKASALGIECVLNDPPLAEATGDAKYRPLEEIFECDVVSLHVPLERETAHPTYHLVDDSFLRLMKPRSFLINSARGPVVRTHDLKKALNDGHIRAAVLDVWEGEPLVNTDLLWRVFIGTPHIAGYSFDGKVNGTRQIYEAACAFLNTQPDWDPTPLLPEPEIPLVKLNGAASDPTEEIRKAVYAVYDIWRDDAAMGEILNMSKEKQAGHFDKLRKEYPRRREFFNTKAVISPSNEQLERTMSGLGFQTAAD